MTIPLKKPKTSRSLTATLAIAFLVLSVAVLLIAGSVQIYLNFVTQQETIAGQQQLIAQDAANRVASFTREKFGELEAAVRFGNPAAASPEEQQRALDNLLGLEPAFRTLILLDPQEQELARVSRVSQAVAEQLAGQVERDLFTQVEQGNRYISSVYID